MCGIAAIFLEPGARSVAQWAEIKACFTQNLIFNQVRGASASGIAVVRAGGQVEIAKQPLPASEFVETGVYKSLLDAAGPDTVLLLGHARDPTKGPPENPHNNHPIRTVHTVGVHNGHIDNDDVLFAEGGWERGGEVDSEVIFRLLDLVPPLPGAPTAYADALRDQIIRLDGTFATISVDLRYPARLVVLKHKRPLCIHHDNGVFHFSSRYIFLRRAFGRSVVTEALDSNSIYLFDAGGPKRFQLFDDEEKKAKLPGTIWISKPFAKLGRGD